MALKKQAFLKIVSINIVLNNHAWLNRIFEPSVPVKLVLSNFAAEKFVLKSLHFVKLAFEKLVYMQTVSVRSYSERSFPDRSE